MRKFVFLFSIILISGCVSAGTSHINPRILIYDNFPQRVGVFPFTGDQPYAERATELFSIGLIEIPYFQQVVERGKIYQVLQELGYQYSGFVDNETIMELGKHLGLDAIFTGNVVTCNTFSWIDAAVTIKLIDVKTGTILWGSDTKDNRLFGIATDLSVSTRIAVDNALKKIKKDLGKIRKADLEIKSKKIEIENKKAIKDKNNPGV